MAQDFIINGTTISRLTVLNWADEEGDSESLAGYTPLARWRRLTGSTNILSASEWNTLRGLEGQRVTITAPPYDDRNNASYRSYYGAKFERLSGQHNGPVIEGVTVEFLVRV